MEKRIVSLFNDHILMEAAEKFAIPYHTIKLIGKHQSFVFEYSLKGKPYILRITHESHRSVDMIMAELDWIIYLSENGVSVSKPIPSVHNQFVEVLACSNATFIATSFEKSPGHRPGPSDWNPEALKAQGEITGYMHKLAKGFRPKNKRYEWDDNDFISNADLYIPKSQEKVLFNYKELIEDLHELPKGSDVYGIIHGDILGSNFFIENGKITLFDFDESSYSWFMNDIAIQIFYCSINMNGHVDEESSHYFTKHFFEGYFKQNHLDENWFEQIPFFLKLREFILYTAIYKSHDLSKLDDWTQGFMNERQVRLENKAPFISIDFTKYAI
ncbi:phosphotransferase enzyme family protein [Chengkuizengella axinellae]|uniref:Phosphotransferase n=1 Tax=Chengkuizengella axinellae TaxID=3064388 RepID=A0ABT9IVL0_9BACL|nr:phosphotransferase [Chengkuizengella sp. 2205SS18-9]MDP5272849.1 phosphotransferase [Chengkuizengella sp. 2205SS18-9]